MVRARPACCCHTRVSKEGGERSILRGQASYWHVVSLQFSLDDSLDTDERVFRTDGVGDEDADDCCVFVLYLPSTCKVVRHARVDERAVEFEANEEFVVIVRSILPIHSFILIFYVVEHHRSTRTINSILNDPLHSLHNPLVLPPPPLPPPLHASNITTTSSALCNLETLSNASQHYYQPHHRQRHQESGSVCKSMF